MNIIAQLFAKVFGEKIVAKLAGAAAPANPGKGLVQSKTVWGVFIAVAGPWLLAKYGLTASDLGAIANDVMQIGGSALALYGRMKAVKPIGVAPGK